MMKFIKVLVLFALCSLPAPAGAGVWTLVRDQTEISFSARQAGDITVKGTVPVAKGRFCFEERDLEDTRAEITFGVLEITTGVRERDDILHAPEWLDSLNHPTGAFKLKTFSRLGPNSYRAAGELTLKGTTREVAFPLTLDLVDERAMGALTIDRRDFNIGEGSWGETEKWVGFPISIAFDIKAHLTGQPCDD